MADSTTQTLGRPGALLSHLSLGMLAIALAAGTARGNTIDFDAAPGACVFADALPVRSELAAEGVSFERGGAILDNRCAVFVDGDGSPNVLAYNGGPGLVFADGEPGHGADTMWFADEMGQVSFQVGIGGGVGVPELIGGVFVADAYDAAGALVASASLPLGRTMQSVLLGGGIVRVDYAVLGQPADLVGEGAFAIDGLHFVPVPEAAAWQLLLLGGLPLLLRAGGYRARPPARPPRA